MLGCQPYSIWVGQGCAFCSRDNDALDYLWVASRSNMKTAIQWLLVFICWNSFSGAISDIISNPAIFYDLRAVSAANGGARYE
jgi:hypothetical protein